MNKFYMVYYPKGNMPRVRHARKELAQAEATRLARLNPGHEFYVLSAFERYTTCVPSVTKEKLMEAPHE